MRSQILLTMLSIVALLSACQSSKPHYKIGVSQCSADIWRDKQNAELRMGAYFHDNVELLFASAYDSDERQVQQIDSLVEAGIDLLIVAPNQVSTISTAIDRAYDQGIPVIVFERKTNSRKYSAFISADNYEMGRIMGNYIASQLKGGGKVVEVMGLKGSSPAIERHKGFSDAVKRHPGLQVVATLQGDWTEESGRTAMAHWLATTEGSQAVANGIDYVFGQNDRMAIGARQAILSEASKMKGSQPDSLTTKFCGIDGLANPGGGLQLVRDSVLDASYIYPTHGDALLQLAVNILEGRPYQKETALMSALVTRDNAQVLLMQSEEIARRSASLDMLHDKADEYLSELDTQRTITLMACGIIALLLVVIVLFYLYHQGKITLRRERVVNNLWNLDTHQAPLDEEHKAQKEANEDIRLKAEECSSNKEGHEAARMEHEEQVASPSTDEPPREALASSQFINRFKEVVEARLSDSDLSVEDLAAAMNLSRVQLYRKVKSITGSSPVELLRTTRLNRAYQQLLTTSLTVSEVAYAVGFSSPSYFTKCYKDEFGMLPGDSRQ